MIRKVSENKGNSIIEVVMVMMLLVLVGVTIYTLISSGADMQERIIRNKDEQINARIASSYIDVSLRQASGENLSIVEHPETGELSILASDVINGIDKWIYFEDGAIYEYLGTTGALPDKILSDPIVEVKSFKIEYDPETNTVTSRIFYEYEGSEKELSTKINLRFNNVISDMDS